MSPRLTGVLLSIPSWNPAYRPRGRSSCQPLGLCVVVPLHMIETERAASSFSASVRAIADVILSCGEIDCKESLGTSGRRLPSDFHKRSAQW
jgi:hypothetical protein